ncbi:Serine/threonine-protein kinase RIO1 [Linnemannia gamsii]|uniref:non-specific serine/threonine protein kinase n=1 Tax=Linnemannia gamsii TaxID=64522 RepID=A0ABQ7K612_9FUNG|nr:Serine/threonine-protein kinase RIO1 [Linnemannia gamsii]
MTPPPIPNSNSNGGGFRASLRSLGIRGPATSSSSSPSPPPTATTTPTQPRFPSSPPQSPTRSATTPLPLPVSVHPAQASAVSSSSSSPTSKQRRSSFGHGFLCMDRSSSRDGSPSSSPSTSKFASSSKSWLPGKMAFLYPKRKPSLPLQSHYLSLPVGSPTKGAGMYMLHSEDLSVTEFAKLAGITIVQDEDDPTTFEASQIIGDEIHEHRRGSSITELTAPPTLDFGASVSAGNTLNSDRNLTVGSSGSFGGGSRKTQIWDPQFWSEPVRDTTTIPTAASYNKLLLPSGSTSSLPITSGSFGAQSVSAFVGNSAPNSPKLKPQTSLPSSGLSYGASSSPTAQIHAPTTLSTLLPPVQQQRRRNSCSPAVLMPAAGSRAAATGAATGSEIDRTRHLTSTGVLSLKRTDQQQLPRPPSKEAVAIQLSQDLGRRKSFSSLTAVALELEGGASGENGQDFLQSGGVETGAPSDLTTATLTTTTTATTPCLFLEPSTPTTPTKAAQFIHPPAVAPPSMSHTLAMHALHTPRPRQSIAPGGSRSSRKGVSRTRSPSPSPLSRQIDMGSSESPQEEKCDPLDEPRQRKDKSDSSLAQLSPPPLANPSSSKSSRQCLAHQKPGKSTKPATMTAAIKKGSSKHLTATVPTKDTTTPVAHHRARSMPLSLSDQQPTNTQHRTPPSTSGSKTPPPSRSLTPASSRSSSPSPSPSPNPDRKFTPGTKVGRFTLVQERCTKHVDLLKAQHAQNAQRRASLGEMGLPTTDSGKRGDKNGMYLSPNSSSSTSSLDTIEWVENPMLTPEDNAQQSQQEQQQQDVQNTNVNQDKGEVEEVEEEEEEGEEDFDSDYLNDLEDELNDFDGWDNATGDFTKHYNRLRQQLQPNKSTNPGAVVSAPAANQPRKTLSKAAKKAAAAQAAAQASASDVIQEKSEDSTMLGDQIDALSSKFEGRLHLGETSVAAPMLERGNVGSKKGSGDRTKNTDKSDRATSDQVLDPRTRIILFKMLNRNIIYEVNGCISTGKEANVYHARTEAGEHRAIKIYKTSILVFKDRDRYVSGEYRFRHGYNKSNPRKMVKIWAEKEMRNLKRIHQAGIPSPEPLVLRMHVLVMGFLGDKNGWAYPRLKDAQIDADRYPSLYFQLVKYMRIMYQTCHLVHADLSEYNILYHSKTLYIIDVSQSVEHDHPHAFNFLRMDITNVSDYFRKKRVAVMGQKELFDFITDVSIDMADESMDAELERIMTAMPEDETEAEAEKRMVDDAVFVQSYIPRHLQEVIDVERDVRKVLEGNTEELLYTKMTGIKDVDERPVAVAPVETEEKKKKKKSKKSVAFEDDVAAEEGEEASVVEGGEEKKKKKKKSSKSATDVDAEADVQEEGGEVEANGEEKKKKKKKSKSVDADAEADGVEVEEGEKKKKKKKSSKSADPEAEADAIEGGEVEGEEKKKKKKKSKKVEVEPEVEEEEEEQVLEPVADEEAENSDNSDNDDEDDDEDDEDDEEYDSNDDDFKKQSRGKRNEDKDAKKERKIKSKEEAREKRKNKIPKADKKRKIKSSSSKKK